MDATLDTHKFIAEYLKNLDARVAILVAGYRGKDPATAGQKLLQDPGIQNEILNVIQTRAQALADDTPDLFKKLWLIVSADIHELVQVTQGCCRYCWGKDHRYQRSPEEYRLHMKAGGEEEGGAGYSRKRPPNPQCPECEGEGETRVRHTPSHLLSPAARALCAGYVQTQQGPRLKVHNQQRALEMLVRYQDNWVKPKPPPPPSERHQSPEEKEREARIRRQWNDGTWDPVVHEQEEARFDARESVQYVRKLKQDLEAAERECRLRLARLPVEEAAQIQSAHQPNKPTPPARASAVIPTERSDEGSCRSAPPARAVDVAVIPSNVEGSCLVRAAHAAAVTPSPLAGEGWGEGTAPQARDLVPLPPEGGGKGEGCAPPARAVPQKERDAQTSPSETGPPQ